MHPRLLAQVMTLPDGTVLNGPSGFQFTKLGQVIGKTIPYTILFAGIGMLLMLIAGGLGLMTGGSDPKQLDNARKQLTFGIVGFLVVFLAYWGVQLIGKIFGLTEFTNIFQ